MPRKIYKHTFKVTVLSDNAESVPEMSLEDIAHSINEGDDIGMLEHTDVQEVPPDKVQVELLLIGNDGTFFDDLDGDDTEPDYSIEGDEPEPQWPVVDPTKESTTFPISMWRHYQREGKTELEYWAWVAQVEKEQELNR
jgi:hypothetical protein